MSKKSGEKLCVIMTGFSCNNNCVVCSVRPFAKKNRDKSFSEIEQMMVSSREKEISSVEFTGGEPTIRKDIIKLISRAKELGFREIALSTNARYFSYRPFLDAAVSAGLNRVTTTIDGHNAKLHDLITRTPGSFDETKAGIIELIKSGVETSANTVLCSLNAPFLREVGETISSFGVEVWGILDLIPDGNIADVYPKFSVPLSEIRESLHRAFSAVSDMQFLELFDFSYCVIPEEIRNSPKTIIFDAFKRSTILKQVGYDPQRFSESGGFYEDIHKERLSGCINCLNNKECAGIWKEHMAAHGDDERFTKDNFIS